MSHPHRASLPFMPNRIRSLPVSAKGYPIPYFVATVNGEPDFRVADREKLARCVNEKRCWVCGDPLGKFVSFTIGPMCSINRISAEPPSHRECAVFSATACPFLIMPKAVRREAGMPEEKGDPGGIMVERNPGVTLVWTTTGYKSFRSNGGILFQLGEPTATQWYAQGRVATQDEVMESIKTGLPLLQDMAAVDGPEAVRELAAMTLDAMKFVPTLSVVPA
jgi:hypothetical protein